jgi:hypothetical protein
MRRAPLRVVINVVNLQECATSTGVRSDTVSCQDDYRAQTLARHWKIFARIGDMNCVGRSADEIRKLLRQVEVLRCAMTGACLSCCVQIARFFHKHVSATGHKTGTACVHYSRLALHGSNTVRIALHFWCTGDIAVQFTAINPLRFMRAYVNTVRSGSSLHNRSLLGRVQRRNVASDDLWACFTKS